MFKKILIANRGEIAVRVMRTCREMGIRTVAVYSDVDRVALHVQMADEAYRVGPSVASESYLCIERILEIADLAGANAIHPGYGFLSENGDFAEACERAKVKFIGPGVAAIRQMGSKTEAREVMQAAGVPVVPGKPNPPVPTRPVSPRGSSGSSSVPRSPRPLKERGPATSSPPPRSATNATVISICAGRSASASRFARMTAS